MQTLKMIKEYKKTFYEIIHLQHQGYWQVLCQIWQLIYHYYVQLVVPSDYNLLLYHPVISFRPGYLFLIIQKFTFIIRSNKIKEQLFCLYGILINLLKQS